MCVCLLNFPCVYVDNMLRLNKKDVTAMAKQMKTASHASPAKKLKI